MHNRSHKPTEKPNFLELSLQMQQLLILLYRFRFLTTKHLQSLLFQKAYSRNKLRLNSLEEKGYIKGTYTPYITTGRTPTIYTLQKNGFAFIKSLTGMNTYLRKLQNERLPRYTLLRHALTAGDIAVTITTYCIAKNLTFTLHTKADIANTRDYTLIKPDIFLKTENASYFIELDLGTETEKQLQKKLQAYITHYQRHTWQHYSTDLYPCIIFISLSPKRIETLTASFERVLRQNNNPPVTVKITALEQVTVSGLENNICVSPFCNDERFLFLI